MEETTNERNTEMYDYIDELQQAEPGTVMTPDETLRFEQETIEYEIEKRYAEMGRLQSEIDKLNSRYNLLSIHADYSS